MIYKSLKIGNWCSVGIDEVRHEYVLENCEGFSSAPTYYSISEEEFNSFPWNSEDQSNLPTSLVKRLLGPSYYALKEIKPTVKELLINYIEKHSHNFKIVNK